MKILNFISVKKLDMILILTGISECCVIIIHPLSHRAHRVASRRPSSIVPVD